MKYYAVAKGIKTGIFTSWDEAKQYVLKFPGAIYKSFTDEEEAIQFLNMNGCPTDNIKAQNKDDIKNCSLSHREKIYTDGSCVDAVGGYGYVYLKNEINHEEYCGKVLELNEENKCTNQIAELYAIYKSLENCPFDKIDLYTDSKYSIGCLTEWWFRWEKNGWKNSKREDVANQGLIKRILIILRHKDVKFYHVYGHTGNKWNELADKLANEGRFEQFEFL